MIKEKKVLEEYRSKNAEYQKKRIALFREPEEKAHEAAEDLLIYELRSQVESDVAKLIKRAWTLYRKIWNGSPTKADVDKFVKLADAIMEYEDFISADMIKVWQVSRDLIWAFGQSYQQREIK